MNAGHQSMMSESYPWDYRIEYLHCTDYRCFLVFPYLLMDAGTPEELSIVVATDAAPTGDRKFLGSNMWFGCATYGGSWRNSGFYSWDSGGGSGSVNYTGFRWTVYRNGASDAGATLANVATGNIDWTGAGPASTSSDAMNKWSPPQKGQYAYGWGQDRTPELTSGNWYSWLGIGSNVNLVTAIQVNSAGTTEAWPLSSSLTPPAMKINIGSGEFISHKFYDFYRKVNGVCTAHLIPCVMGGVIGVYDEIGRQFYSSYNSYNFEAGPQIADNGGYKVP
ncbi:MAG: hypothetical protein IKF72_09840 [Kiritimatiellae bacterium]|nr:hypothetical protein [Kiritimatiellia bacterium]